MLLDAVTVLDRVSVKLTVTVTLPGVTDAVMGPTALPLELLKAEIELDASDGEMISVIVIVIGPEVVTGEATELLTTLEYGDKVTTGTVVVDAVIGPTAELLELIGLGEMTTGTVEADVLIGPTAVLLVLEAWTGEATLEYGVTVTVVGIVKVINSVSVELVPGMETRIVSVVSTPVMAPTSTPVCVLDDDVVARVAFDVPTVLPF